MQRLILFAVPVFILSFILPQMENNTTTPNAGQSDGPYVWYANGQVQVRYIVEEKGIKSVKADSVAESAKENLVLSIATDTVGKTFDVKLKKKIQKEKSEYKKPSKQFVVSDIEGNFGAFRKILQAGGVMDAQFNWTFGEGHLVLVGDFCDRGEQVTEVFWLIYSLEEKAKAAGGYVHFVLGNHEIMNMSGDIRYVHKKYIESASLLSQPFVGLLGENTELGKWLRSKNIVEKIGDMLYTHGGISTPINIMDISIPTMNELSQPFYPDSTYAYPDPRLDIIFSDNGPFWYRGYYKANPVATESQIDSTRDKFKIRHIVTGHTVLADTISVLHNGKLINTDVHHAGGHSEAMLITEDNFYRVLPTGEKILLMTKKR